MRSRSSKARLLAHPNLYSRPHLTPNRTLILTLVLTVTPTITPHPNPDPSLNPKPALPLFFAVPGQLEGLEVSQKTAEEEARTADAP